MWDEDAICPCCVCSAAVLMSTATNGGMPMADIPGKTQSLEFMRQSFYLLPCPPNKVGTLMHARSVSPERCGHAREQPVVQP
jgi:hypothetical protein